MTLAAAILTKAQFTMKEVALEDTAQGICIPKVKPEYEDLNESSIQVLQAGEERLQPLTVNCMLSALFRVCRESRYVAKKTIRHHEDDCGACSAPSRDYDPRTDLLFLTWELYSAFRMKNWSRVAEIKHIGFRWPRHYTQWLFFMLLLRDIPQFSNLQDVTLVDTGEINLYHAPGTQRFCLERRPLELEDDQRTVLNFWFWMANRDMVPKGSRFSVDICYARLKRD
ncbi:hypothetical protein F5Y06DRAFT_291300 [Hypoxylon sp. FL0890]|nr:hypothetical protein F5Y06DRAFT_291300 [Hypoxylon sp. FL0890]